MRHGRAKAARKTLQYFGRTIGLKSPYAILLDATFVAAIFQQKILPLKPRLDRVLQTPPTIHNKYCITKEAVDELRQILEGLEKRKHTKAIAFREALEWVSKECILLPSTTTAVPAEENPDEAPTKKRKQSSLSTPAQEALLHNMEENETPYIVASQDEELLTILRQKGGVPIVRLANHTVLLLEQPSKQTQFQAKGSEQQKWRHNLPEAEKALVDLAKKATKETIHGIDEGQPQQKQQQQQPIRPRIKKAKGPNPLSCKRKEQPTNDKPKESSSKKRRKRAHKNASSNEESH